MLTATTDYTYGRRDIGTRVPLGTWGTLGLGGGGVALFLMYLVYLGSGPSTTLLGLRDLDLSEEMLQQMRGEMPIAPVYCFGDHGFHTEKTKKLFRRLQGLPIVVRTNTYNV